MDKDENARPPFPFQTNPLSMAFVKILHVLREHLQDLSVLSSCRFGVQSDKRV